MKKVLITGADSYIGVSVENWLNQWQEAYAVDTIDMRNASWQEKSFEGYDTVFHVAGIAHADVGNVSEETRQLYYKINTELALETARKAQAEGVKQFIFMSSMIVYGGCREKIIFKNTKPKPANFYGDSKWQADKALQEMNSHEFKVVVVRPPMIYGRGSKGNYPQLAKMASRLPIFPIVNNKRSMLYIDNLCQFIKLMIDHEETGVFFPQNNEYTNTSAMVKMIADAKSHKILMIPGLNWAVKLMMKCPGKIGGLANKAFGDSAYEMSLSTYKENYCIKTLSESIQITESNL